MSRSVIDSARAARDYLLLPAHAKLSHLRDHFGPPSRDPGIEAAIEAGIAWLGSAQDNAAPKDGGVARHFSLLTGWSASYPETTGYIIPTMIEYAKLYRQQTTRQRAKRMLDWLVSIQLPNGAFQAGMVNAEPRVPVTFNTGQILLGLAAGVDDFGHEYREAMLRAANWLVESQDADGCWRKYPTPFARPGEKTYETHVAWGLFEAARIEPLKPYAAAAIANVHWALGFQHENGWFEQCCLTDPSQPLSHTVGYVLRGLVEAYRFTRDADLLRACQKTADGLLKAVRGNGFLPGRLRPDWSGAVPWSCLTGSVQIAICWLLLYEETRKNDYRDAACAVNRYVRRTVKIDAPYQIRGAVKGSFPIYGDYGRDEYLNWACKFFVDSNLLEKRVQQSPS